MAGDPFSAIGRPLAGAALTTAGRTKGRRRMRVLKGRIDWMEGWANDPRLELLVDRVARIEDHRYEKRGSLYFSELDGDVSFFSYSSPGQGFGGRQFRLRMADGSEQTLVGPWSSNSEAMNRAGFPRCVEVAVTDDPAAFARRYTFTSAAITVDRLRAAADLIDVPDFGDRETWRSTVPRSDLPLGPRAQSMAGARFELVGWDDAPWHKGANQVELSGEQSRVLDAMLGHPGVVLPCDRPAVYYTFGARLPDGSLWTKHP